MAVTHTFSKKEELANSITHGVGALLSISALVILIVYASLYGTVWHVVSFTIFGVTMFILYMSSTLLHSLPEGKAKDIFEIFDHSSIYFFIAGTYTPFLLIVIKGTLGWSLFGIVWGLAIAGTVFKCFFVKKYLFSSTALYVVMGWLIVFAWKPLVNNLSLEGMTYLAIGGALYTLGAIFYVWRGFKYHHAVWHLFVLAASVAHFFCVLFYVLPIHS
ncbi:hemolysin III family protein [Bacillus sp. ISL-40]|uniref:PAQR family membrane homeostasis protein TrhA n=1 Tax=unclassified Bacillus (in: firmicutes) TaxID=185979 RepID=UPI001BECCD6B|nr:MULTISPECIES: hemolysin III family protein [unclassified Bacillus (in: firmicutes)]MBT2696696.1 hemolysin III family protein [Bacillus sp. ISL-40]MBT2721301.1 hemolysin III family protein [Bacillus sp. ISL-46]MBT2740013.1 hemolysin III family protein [Bacillus sp. ISL-77]